MLLNHIQMWLTYVKLFVKLLFKVYLPFWRSFCHWILVK